MSTGQALSFEDALIGILCIQFELIEDEGVVPQAALAALSLKYVKVQGLLIVYCSLRRVPDRYCLKLLLQAVGHRLLP